jgi:Fe-S cluster biogenesis protein NfuA
MTTAQSEVGIRMAPTPNPNAWKFIITQSVLNQGKASYSDPEDCGTNLMAYDLLQLKGVVQVHFFSNVITVTHNEEVDIDDLRDLIYAVIQRDLPIHNPNITPESEKKKKRENLSPELENIEKILDRTIRPGLQGDGGDIEIVKYEHPELWIFYEGACGTCPSATQGTLMAIESILRDELGTEITVIPINQ